MGDGCASGIGLFDPGWRVDYDRRIPAMHAADNPLAW